MFKISLRSKGLSLNTNVYTPLMQMTLHSLQRQKIYNRINELNTFSNFSGLNSNKRKCEIAGAGVLNWVQVALCSLKCVNLNTKFLKILGVHFSYNKNFEQDKNFNNFNNY